MVIGFLNVENDITGMLGSFRERAEQQLALQDIELDWRMIDIPEIEGLNPSKALNILRIMQEATTNAAKHSGADRLLIEFKLVDVAQSHLRIDIGDNGCGFGEDVNAGHGLTNMIDRARELGGKIEISPRLPGTMVSFTIPIGTRPPF